SLLIKHIRLVIPISMWLHCSNRSYIKVMMLVNRSTLHLLSAPFIMRSALAFLLLLTITSSTFALRGALYRFRRWSLPNVLHDNIGRQDFLRFGRDAPITFPNGYFEVDKNDATDMTGYAN
uniref:Uncharacterized protein n=1 Tax=Parascaris univalens TaxID=6257 RepID=A0A915C4A2_PARUN